ncbi:MAG: retron system putative HNH endonuclease [Bacteroidota bacterium]
MLYIQKEGREPKEFIAWKQARKAELAKAYEEKSGPEIWKILQSSPPKVRDEEIDQTLYYDKKALKLFLTQEQGSLCAYCGKKIQGGDDTSIEHLKPKSKHKTSTFDFNNLVASCMGGTKLIAHRATEEDSWESIYQQYGVDRDYLTFIHEYHDSLSETSSIKKKFPGFYLRPDEELVVGEQVLVSPQRNRKAQHCDARKGKKELTILPTEAGCYTRFRYHEADITFADLDTIGKIITEPSQPQEVIETVRILGLNDNPDLNRIRASHIQAAREAREEARKLYPGPYS